MNLARLSSTHVFQEFAQVFHGARLINASECHV